MDSFGDVFDQYGNNLMPTRYDAKGQKIPPPDLGPSRHRFHVFVNLRDTAGGEHLPYDLVRHPQDICIQLGAHEMMVPDIHTNVVRVPAAILRKAIARATLERITPHG